MKQLQSEAVHCLFLKVLIVLFKSLTLTDNTQKLLETWGSLFLNLLSEPFKCPVMPY